MVICWHGKISFVKSETQIWWEKAVSFFTYFYLTPFKELECFFLLSCVRQQIFLHSSSCLRLCVKPTLQCNNPTAQLLCSCSHVSHAINDAFDVLNDAMPNSSTQKQWWTLSSVTEDNIFLLQTNQSIRRKNVNLILLCFQAIWHMEYQKGHACFSATQRCCDKRGDAARSVAAALTMAITHKQAKSQSIHHHHAIRR